MTTRPRAHGRLPRIAVIADFLEEKWPSMDLAAEQLATHLALRGDVESSLFRPPLRLPHAGSPPSALGRAFGRFVQFPLELAPVRFTADYFHVADHSYGHLALLFPSDRVGVYCHDIDAYRALLPGSGASRSRVLLSQLLLRGLRHARVVFHSTLTVREEILRHGFVPASRLVHAPLGIAQEYLDVPLRSAATPPYLLHVGSCIPRKNIELLLQVFATARKRIADLQLLQIGGDWTSAHRAYLEQHQLGLHVQQRRGISRADLAGLYAGATAVLVPSLAEGFGLPVVEALACGALVIASDIPVLREVGSEGVRFCSLTNPSEWAQSIEDAAATVTRHSSDVRASVAERYTWRAQAEIIGNEYIRRPQAR